ncbi:MAG TPA: hypothetical protein VF462_15145 [Micromonosporaceae bacterium]
MIIASRFNGPPDTGNGGYSAGLFASARGAAAGRAVEVTLRRPPPLDILLTADGGEVRDAAGELVAEVREIDTFTAIVPSVAAAEANRASAAYPGFADHPFPTCYVCGPQRTDGLRIFPGPTADGRTAAPFVVPTDVEPPTVWAALDCPGGWSIIAPGRPYVMGRMAAVVSAVPEPGDECVVVGATAEVSGRKALVHSTLYGPSGAVLGYARATWIAI